MSAGTAVRGAALGAVAVALGVLYYAVDPARSAWMPRCPLKWMTGLECPGCGSQRAVHALLHGDIAAAWHANALLVALLPAIAAGIWLELRRESHPRLYARVHSPLAIIAAGAVIAVWGVARNL